MLSSENLEKYLKLQKLTLHYSQSHTGCAHLNYLGSADSLTFYVRSLLDSTHSYLYPMTIIFFSDVSSESVTRKLDHCIDFLVAELASNSQTSAVGENIFIS